MFSKRSLVTLVLTASLAISVNAAPYKVTVSGKIDTLENSHGVFGPSFAIAERISYSFLYDTAAPDLSPAPDYGFYAAQFLRAGTATESFYDFANPLAPINVDAGAFSPSVSSQADEYLPTTGNRRIAVHASFAIYGNVFTNHDELPDFSKLVGLPGRVLLSYSKEELDPSSGFYTPYESSHALASIDSVSVQAVPEPASLAAVGLGALGILKRRKKA